MDEFQPGSGDQSPLEKLQGLLGSKANYVMGLGLFIVGNVTGYFMGHSKSNAGPAPAVAAATASESMAPAPARKGKKMAHTKAVKKPAGKKKTKGHKA